MVFLVVTLMGFSANAQYAISWWTMDAGGGRCTGGDYVLRGTIGQPDPGALTNATYVLTGGFWTEGTRAQEGPLPTLTITRAGRDQVRISWSPDAPGFVLQQSPSISHPNWVNSATGNTHPVVITTGAQPVFYRLFKP